MNMHFLQSEPGDDPVIVEALFRASVSRVYQAWTEPEKIMKWFGPKAGSLVSADIDLCIGGKWCFVISSDENGKYMLQGEYEEIEANKRLVFSWSHVKEYVDGTHEETPKSRVVITFETHGLATRVRLQHEGIVKRDNRNGVGNGWERTFKHLEDLLAE